MDIENCKQLSYLKADSEKLLDRTERKISDFDATSTDVESKDDSKYIEQDVMF